MEIVLAIFFGFLIFVLNAYTFLVSFSFGPVSLFFDSQSALLVVLFATIALPGVILGTIVGIITFRWTKW